MAFKFPKKLPKSWLEAIERNGRIGSKIYGLKVVGKDKRGTIVHIGGDGFKILHGGKNQNVFGNPLIGGSDPTFGYTSIGTGGYDVFATQSTQYITGSIFTAPQSGTADSMTVALKGYREKAGHVQCAIYKRSDLSLLGYTPEESPTFTTSYAWYTCLFASPGPSLVANEDYVLVAWGNQPGLSDDALYIPFGAGTTNQGVRQTEDYLAGYWPDPLAPSYNNNKYSIYCTYSLPHKSLTQSVSVSTKSTPLSSFRRSFIQPIKVSSVLSKTLPPMSLTQMIGVLDSLQPKAIEKLSEQPITVLSTLTKIGVFERIFSQPITVVQSFTSELSTVSVITRHTTEVSLSAGRVDTRTYRRAYIEWDISDIPSGVTITAVKLRYHGKANGLDKSSIYSIESQPSAQPDTDTGNKAVYDDITDGKCYVSESETFPTVGSDQEIDLGSDAVADLQAALNADRAWFAVGIKTSEETIGEFDEVYSEEYEDANPKPTLSVTYTTLSAPTYAGVYATRMEKVTDNYLRQDLVAKVPTDLVESISFYAKADTTPAQIEVLVHYDDYFSDTTTINLSTEYAQYFAKFSPGKNMDYMKITYVGDTESGKYLYFDRFVIDFHELEVKGSIDSYIQPFQEIDTSLTRDTSGKITKIEMENATRKVTLTITRDANGRVISITRKVT